MADVISFAGTGVVYRNGCITTGVTNIGVRHTSLPEIERSVVVAQSGILNTRFDDRVYYSDSGV